MSRLASESKPTKLTSGIKRIQENVIKVANLFVFASILMRDRELSIARLLRAKVFTTLSPVNVGASIWMRDL